MILRKSDTPVNIALFWYTSADLSQTFILDTATGDFPASQFNGAFWNVRKTPDSPILFSCTLANGRLSLSTVTIDARQKTLVALTNAGDRSMPEGVYFHELVMQDVTDNRVSYIFGALNRPKGLLQ